MPTNLFALNSPYGSFDAINTAWTPDESLRGTAIVWFVTSSPCVASEFEFLLQRPRGVSCVLILPPPMEIPAVGPFLHRLSELEPNAVLPTGRFATPLGVRAAVAAGPRSLSRAVVSYLWRHGIVSDRAVRTEIYRVFQLAPKTATISALCRSMYLSRRTLGRHFEALKLPVPSHWLQFARILHVLVRAQSEQVALFRLAIAAGYPDGFTFSNQVKRLLGLRPSEARDRVGYEWLVEAWLGNERRERELPSESVED